MPETVELPQETPTRILVVDDDDAFRETVCAAIARDDALVLAGQVSNAEGAREAIAHGEFDVALIDLGLPDGNGIDLIREIASTRPETDVMVVTVFGDEAHVLASIEAGATGYLLKDAPRDELLRAVRAAAAGQSVLAPSVATRLMHRVRAPEPELLSHRELEVLGLVAAGTTNRETAARLFISEATVKTHLLHIYAKLGVTDRAAAVAEAFNRGLLTPGRSGAREP